MLLIASPAVLGDDARHPLVPARLGGLKYKTTSVMADRLGVALSYQSKSADLVVRIYTSEDCAPSPDAASACSAAEFERVAIVEMMAVGWRAIELVGEGAAGLGAGRSLPARQATFSASDSAGPRLVVVWLAGGPSQYFVACLSAGTSSEVVGGAGRAALERDLGDLIAGWKQ